MTNWWPGIIALMVGAAGAAIALAVLGKTPAPSLDQATLPDLDAKIAACKAALKELGADKHLYDDVAFATERTRLEHEATAAMRARDALKKNPATPFASKPVAIAPAASSSAPGFFAVHPRLTGAVWGGGLVGFIAFAFFMVTRTGTPHSPKPVASANDPRYEAMLVLSAISISFGDSEQLLQAWEIYMRQIPPRRRPPQLQRALDWLEKASNGEDLRE